MYSCQRLGGPQYQSATLVSSRLNTIKPWPKPRQPARAVKHTDVSICPHGPRSGAGRRAGTGARATMIIRTARDFAHLQVRAEAPQDRLVLDNFFFLRRHYEYVPDHLRIDVTVTKHPVTVVRVYCVIPRKNRSSHTSGLRQLTGKRGVSTLLVPLGSSRGVASRWSTTLIAASALPESSRALEFAARGVACML